MAIVRNSIAVILGYAVFAISAVLLFQWSGIDPHKDPSVNFIIATIIYGMVFSFVGGFLTQLISKTGKLTINYVLAMMMAAFAAFSLIKTSGNHYSQFAAIFLFAPTSLLGGFVCLRKTRK